MKHITILVLLLCSFACCSVEASACFCLVRDVSEEASTADAVFLGRVTEIVKPRPYDEKASFVDRAHTAKFKIERSWKGTASEEISVLFSMDLDCLAGPSFEVGERYLVYAGYADTDVGQKNRLLGADSCSRTVRIPKPEPESGTAKTDGKRLTSGLISFVERDVSEDVEVLDRLRRCGCLVGDTLRKWFDANNFTHPRSTDPPPPCFECLHKWAPAILTFTIKPQPLLPFRVSR